MRFVDEYDAVLGAFVVRDTGSELGGTLEPVCRCSTAFQADAIAIALNATWAGDPEAIEALIRRTGLEEELRVRLDREEQR